MLVTVWAFEQEDPKLLAKWRRIQEPETLAPARHAGASTAAATEPASGFDSGPPAVKDDTAGTSGSSLDYMVPWHLPRHRLEAAAVAARTTSSTEPQTSMPAGRIDAAKNTIVFDRYYHLFRRGELEDLAAGVLDVAVANSFYDKSNWCMVMQRQGGEVAVSSAAAAQRHTKAIA